MGHRSAWLRIGSALVALGAVWAAWAAWTAVAVSRDARAAQDELDRQREELGVEELLTGGAVDDLRAAAARFDGIARRLDQPLLAPARLLPVFGRQMSAARHQADAASAGLLAAVDIGTELQHLLDGGLGSGPGRVEALRSAARIAALGQQDLEALDLGPAEALIGALDDSRREVEDVRTEAVAALGRVEAVSLALAELFEGPGDYLVLAANNAQMQNGQGMFLSAGVLHLEGGHMELASMESIGSLPAVATRVPLEEDLAARWGWLDPNDDLRHLGLSARFPVTARTAAELWAAMGRPVDGVIVVDPYVLAALMTATGPVSTPMGELGPDEVVAFALHGQYQGYLSAGDDSSYTEERRDVLEHIATTVLGELEVLERVDADLVEHLLAAARGRHLLVWSADPELQAGWEAADLDGQIGEQSLLLSLVNRSGTKLDWFIEMSAQLDAEPVSDGYDVVLDVTIANHAPPDGEPAYVVGPYPASDLARGEHLGLVTLNLPAAATQNRFDGVGSLAVAGADGPNRVIAMWVSVQPGTTTHVTARFHLPASTTSLVVEPSARAHPTRWTYGAEVWDDARRSTLDLVPDRPGPGERAP